MKAVSRSDISIVKMLHSPPDVVVTCGDKVINNDDFIYSYCYLRCSWLKERKATIEDYKNIPQLLL